MDIKEKPGMKKPKVLNKALIAPREVTNIIKAQYQTRHNQPKENSAESPNDYAIGQSEKTLKGAVTYSKDSAKRMSNATIKKFKQAKLEHRSPTATQASSASAKSPAKATPTTDSTNPLDIPKSPTASHHHPISRRRSATVKAKGQFTPQGPKVRLSKIKSRPVRTAKKMQKHAKQAKNAYKRAKQTAKAAQKGAKATFKAAIQIVKASVATAKGVITLIVSGGGVAVLIILLIVAVAMALTAPNENNDGEHYPVSPEVMQYASFISLYTEQNNIPEYAPVIYAIMMQESGGLGLDPMQCSESPLNTKYPNTPNSIQDPVYSVEIGIQYFSKCLQAANCESPFDIPGLSLALQHYNFGNGYAQWAIRNFGGYSAANARVFSDEQAAAHGWQSYGDVDYVPHVLRYYSTRGESSSAAFLISLNALVMHWEQTRLSYTSINCIADFLQT